MGCVVEIESPFNTTLKKWIHYLFDCPSFWRFRPKYHCSVCGKSARCYWDLNDCFGKINVCNSCKYFLENKSK
jgi:hypothetical protein